MLDVVVLNILFLLAPIACYLVYIVYENTIGKKANNLFFSLTIISSLYLITKYSIYFNYSSDILKVVLLICLLKGKKILSIIISLYIILYFGFINDNNVYLIFFEYFVQLSTFYILLKNRNYKEKILVFTVISMICEISYGYNPFVYILVTNICYSLLALAIVEFINRSEKLINIYGTYRQVEDEKAFRDSLFKVTHEIKNPIAVCKGYLDMINTSDIKQTNKYVSIIKQEIERTLTLMNDFLSLTKLRVEKSELDITLLLDDICSSIESLLIEKDMHFIYDISDQEVYINCDYDRIKQVLMNLIKNSMESIPKNTIGIIKLKMNKNKEKIVITIEDNGIGMDKTTLKRIGEPFFTTKKNGTGLGIKMCKEIIELHNGNIKFFSKVNTGTKVTIELPIKNSR